MTTSQDSKSTTLKILSPQKVLNAYYLDARWHLLEIGAMLDRAQRGETAFPDEDSMNSDLRAALLREALQLLASDSPEPNRTERLLTLFTRLDPKQCEENC